jgi:hypothetical protein
MEGRYYIIQFHKNENGELIRPDLFDFPNGTHFCNAPLHYNSTRDVIITWAKNGAENDTNLNGITITPTNETTEIPILTIAKGLGIDNISRNNATLNNFLVNIFREYVPDVNLN